MDEITYGHELATYPDKDGRTVYTVAFIDEHDERHDLNGRLGDPIHTVAALCIWIDEMAGPGVRAMSRERADELKAEARILYA